MWNERQKRIILNTKQKPQLHLFPYPLSGANNTCIVVIIKRNPRKYKNFYNIRRLDRDLQKFFSKNNLSQKCLNVTEVGLWINIFFTSSKEVDIFLKASRRQIHVDIDLWGSRWRTLFPTPIFWNFSKCFGIFKGKNTLFFQKCSKNGLVAKKMVITF